MKINKEIELMVIDKYNTGLTCRKIAKELNLVHGTISTILKRNGIAPRLYNRSKLSFDNEKELINLYLIKPESLSKISKKYNVSLSCIRNALIKNNVKIREKLGSNRIYSLDETFFDVINTEEKAYILGFLYADGYNNGKSGFVLNLQYRDKEILEKIKKCLKYTGPLGLAKVTKHKQSVLFISSKKLSQRLTELGCHRKKSLNLLFPNESIISESFLTHFIRGYMDGDGCIRTDNKKQGNVSFIGSCNFINTLQSIFIKKFDICGNVRKRNKVKEFTIGGQKQSLCILNWLYKDSTIYLQRKNDKYMLIKNRDLNR